MTDIVFKLDPEIIIGADTLNRTGAICTPIGKRVLIVTEKILYESRSIERLTAILADSGIETIVFDEIPPQATASVAEAAAELARGGRCSAIIGFGGLKTQAIARIVAIIAMPRIDVCELLDGGKWPDNFLPYIAIPTTGRDPFLFTPYFIAIDPRDRSVKQVKAPPELCKAAIFDSKLSENLPDKVTVATAFGGFCTALEAYCSNRSHFMSDPLLEQAIICYTQMMDAAIDPKSGGDRFRCLTQGSFLMALGSALSAPGIGTALAFALNSKFPVAKAWSSTILLPYVLERMVAARPEKIARLAALMGEPVADVSVAEAAARTGEAIRRRMGALQVPARLKDFDLSMDRLVSVAESARNLEFVAFAPWTVTAEDAYDLLKQAY